jgi:MFS family permease
MTDEAERDRGQWLALTMLMSAGFVNYLDRTSLAIAASSIRAEMHLSASDIGALLAAFSLAYGLGQLPVGWLVDRFGPLRVLGLGLGTWSAAQMLTAAVPGLRTFVAMRVALGVGEAPFFPAGIKVVRQYFPEERRGRGIGAMNASTAIAQGVAPPLLTMVMLAVGWRSMFAAIGGVGLLLALLWRAAAKRVGPPRGEAEQRISWATWTGLFRRRIVWGFMLGFGGVNYTTWFYIGWLPTYLQTRGISVANSGWLAAIPFFAGSAGMYVSGVVADVRRRRGESLLRIYMSHIVGGLLLSAASTLVIARVGSLASAITCVSLALFWVHVAGTAAWAYVAAAMEPGLVATVCSIQNFGSYLIASIAPLVTGWLLDRTHSFGSAFGLCAAAGVAGAGVYWFVVRGGTHRGDGRS